MCWKIGFQVSLDDKLSTQVDRGLKLLEDMSIPADPTKLVAAITASAEHTQKLKEAIAAAG